MKNSAKTKKRKSLKKLLLTEIVLFVVIIIVIITAINIKTQSDKISDLSESILARESVSYADEVYSWWRSIEDRVAQTAYVYRNIPELPYDEVLAMLLKLTELDPDSQDIYIGYGDTSVFLDGSGWIPDDTFVFTDREWYTGAIGKNGAIYTSEPYLDASTGKTCLACAIMLRDNVVLSSDINFDKVSERLNGFKSSSDEAKFFIVNKETEDILVSSISGIVGETVDKSADPVMKGLNSVFNSLNTENSIGVKKVETADTEAGRMMYTATDIEETSWVVVSAVPYSFVSNSIMSTVVITFVIAAVLLVLLAVSLYLIITKYIDPVSKVTDRIVDISHGDFTVKLVPEGNNEITTLSERLNDYIADMRTMLLNLANISKDMNSRAAGCFDISHVLFTSNQTQGESIGRLNQTLNMMNDSISRISNDAVELASISGNLANDADDVRNLCENTMKASATGRDEMDIMTKNINTLNDTVHELGDIISVTAKSVEEITGITETISAISSRTNLLSLNASIEAARAGEMGKGFAVVASEVGVLANQSSEATENIRSLIEGITGNIEKINQKAGICIADTDACVSGVEKTNKSFDRIYADVAEATNGIVEIVNGIGRISDVATNNAAITEEQTASITEILELSDMIVKESNKLLDETKNISSISEDLNQYSDEIKSDLSQYTL